MTASERRALQEQIRINEETLARVRRWQVELKRSLPESERRARKAIRQLELAGYL
jgi:hypothetical protein